MTATHGDKISSSFTFSTLQHTKQILGACQTRQQLSPPVNLDEEAFIYPPSHAIKQHDTQL